MNQSACGARFTKAIGLSARTSTKRFGEFTAGGFYERSNELVAASRDVERRLGGGNYARNENSGDQILARRRTTIR